MSTAEALRLVLLGVSAQTEYVSGIYTGEGEKCRRVAEIHRHGGSFTTVISCSVEESDFFTLHEGSVHFFKKIDLEK